VRRPRALPKGYESVAEPFAVLTISFEQRRCSRSGLLLLYSLTGLSGGRNTPDLKAVCLTRERHSPRAIRNKFRQSMEKVLSCRR